MPSNFSLTTNAPPEATTEEFIQKYMSLIVASFIGVIILILLIVAGYIHLTKKKEKSKQSKLSRPRSHREASRTPAPSKSRVDKATKSSPASDSVMSSANSSGTGDQTGKSLKGIAI